ncbi:MAG: carboxypeptidase regulatory-like domain-containing protein [Thermoplasmata archaeon]|nr:carboxypeptidase regulatory-like domain-containing protein [Thermoplasmata archaeon]
MTEKTDVKLRLSDRVIMWCEHHGTTVLYLATLFFVGLLMRVYFATELITQHGPLYLYSGGSDSYYHSRVIEYIVANKHHLVLDTMLNYPTGAINPRAPLFDWMVAVLGTLLAPFFGGDAVLGAAYVLVYIAPVWGSLCIFPLYFLTKDIFGRKTALLAVFLLTFMEAQVERSIATFGNYLPFYMFMVLTTLFFYVRTIKMVGTHRWVSSWRSRKEIAKGLRAFFKNEKRALLYGTMTGVAFGATSMAWQGFTYMEAILLIYLFVQILLNHIRKVDSTGVYIVTMVAMGIGFLLAFPYYYGDQLIPIWFDVPVYLYIGAAVLGFIFVSTRDVPWIIVFPAVGVLLGVLALTVYFINPGYFEIIISGQGYFVKTKVYSTIAEAQAPDFSRVVLAFGAATTFLGILGLGYLLYKTYKSWRVDYIFFATFSMMSVYLAATAGKFTFLGSPMFSVLSAWFIFLLLNIANFPEMRKTFAGTIGGGLWNALKKSVKVTHVVMVLFLAFLVIFPNVWFAVDASIPYETKRKFDKQVYEAMPDFAKPTDYDKVNGSYKYFGAFGFSVPLPSSYWPDAYKWLARQDKNETPEKRPAFLSWWDYGFEAVDMGHHPTVADNFQNGIPVAGNFLMAQNESQGISLMIAHLLYAWYYKDKAKYAEILKAIEDAGVDIAPIKARLGDLKGTIKIVLDNPRVFGPRSSDLNVHNAYYTWASVYLLSNLNLRELAELYNNVMEITGNRIYYFAVDSRLFPFSGSNTGIFYAPAKLSDQRMKGRGESVPYDYYNLKAISEYGGEYELDEIPAGVRIVNYKIEYKDMFYNSLLYRIYVGYSGKDLGIGDGIPSLTSGFENYQRMPGWNMTHFRVVYLTAYWNPYKDYQNHSDAWRAINYDEAYQKQLSGEGTVDLNSRSSIGQSVAMIKYFPGAFFNGTLKLPDGKPVKGLRITVQDEYGIPHMSTVTGEDGRYNLILPFGNLSILVTTGGELNKLSMTDRIQVARMSLNITQDAAYRKNVDRDRDGVWDYIINRDIEISAAKIKGTVYWDNDNSGSYSSSSDNVIPNAKVYLVRNETNDTYTVNTDASGTYIISNIPPGSYNVTALVGSYKTISHTTEGKPNEEVTVDIGIQPAKIDGNVSLGDARMANVTVMLKHENGNILSTTTNETGEFSFERLLPGNYTLYVEDQEYMSEKLEVMLNQGERSTQALQVFKAAKVTGKLKAGNLPAGYASVRFINLDNRKLSDTVTANANGEFSVSLPTGFMYSVYALSVKGDERYSQFTSFILDEDLEITLNLQKSVKIYGEVKSKPTSEVMYGYTMQIDRGNDKLWFFTNYSGYYEIYVPPGTYELKNLAWITGVNWTCLEKRTIHEDTEWNIAVVEGDAYNGRIYYDANENGVYDAGEEIGSARVFFKDEEDRSVYTTAGDDGMFRANLPKDRTYRMKVIANEFNPREFPPMKFAELPGEISLMPVNVSLSGRINFLNFADENISVVLTGGIGNKTYYLNTSNSMNFSMTVVPGNYTVRLEYRHMEENDNDTRYTAGGDTLINTNQKRSVNLTIRKEVNITANLSLSDGTSLNAVVKFTNKTLEMSVDTTADELKNGEFVPVGEWTVECIGERGELHYAAITEISVTKPGNFEFTLHPAHRINVKVEHEAEGVKYIPLMATVDEVTLKKNTDIGGNAEFTVPVNKTVKFWVDYTGTETIFGLNRTVHYEGNNTTVANADKTVKVEVSKEIHSRILTGNVVYGGPRLLSGYVEFISDTTWQKFRTEIVNSSFSIELPADTYNVYAYAKDYAMEYVNLTKVLVKENAEIQLTLYLAKGYRLNVNLMTAVSAENTLRITTSEWKYDISTNSTELSIAVPGGEYKLRASHFGYENGMRVEYADEKTVNVYNTTTAIYLTPQKVVIRAIEVTWNEIEHAVMGQNETRVFTLILKNLGNVEDMVTLTGSPADWKFNFSENDIAIGFGSGNNTRRIDVYVTTPQDARVNHAPVIITAISKTDSTVSNSTRIQIEVMEKRSCALLEASNYRFENGSLAFDIQVKNTGNTPDTFKLKIINADEIAALGWTPKIYVGEREVTNTSEIEPDSTATLTVRLTSGQNAVPIVARTVIKLYAISETNRGDTATAEYKIPVSKFAMNTEDFSAAGERISLKPETIDYSPYIWATAIIIIVLIAILVYFRWGVVR